jgi:tRNA pseudouridine38-40 synthase
VVHLDVDEGCLASAVGRSASAGIDLLARRLNGVLPSDVRVRRCLVAADGFDARFSAEWRRYAYRIADREWAVDPLIRGHVLLWPRQLDEVAMNEAAGALLGEHDFAAFCRRREGATTVRSLLELSWQRDATGMLVGNVRADAFCHHMVRGLTGCLVAVGEGRFGPGWPREVLEAQARDPRVTVLPPHGLTLEEVRYPADDELSQRAERARTVRTRG